MIVGIDLGTTNSAVAYVRDGVPRILAQGQERIMPSIVGLTPQGGLLIGTPARNQYTLYPERTIRSIKRKMGTDERVRLGEQDYSPQEVSALILRELKRRAEAVLGEAVDGAVVTVPAYFSDAARQATREAGEIAGFTVERIINEPTAGALAYGLDRSGERQMVAVYDLGGGTFDVSIIELDAGVVEVRASHGDTQLGGDDFDARLVDFLATRFQDDHQLDPRDDARAMARLSRAAEDAKIALSTQPFVRIREEYLISQGNRPLHLDVEVARSQFEELIADLVDRTLQSLDTALKDAGITADELDKILFVGGSTRVPLVWERVAEHSGLEPEMAVNPDEAVALGAAVQAAIIAGEPLEAILVDVTPHSLGIEVAEMAFGRVIPDRYSAIIGRNTTIPTTKSEVYSALSPQQTRIELKVYQGEEAIASHNTLLGTFMFEGLRPEAAGQPARITVTFDFDLNGILHVSAVDRGSGKQAGMQVKAARVRLGIDEIVSTRGTLEALEAYLDDEDAGEILEGEVQDEVTPSNPEARTLLDRARLLLSRDLNDTPLREAVDALEEALRGGDEGETETRQEALLDLIYDRDDG